MGLLQKLRSTLIYFVLTTVILLAVFSTVLRLLFSFIDSYKLEFESLIGDALKQPVKIESIYARFVGLNPALILKDISLLDLQQKKPFAYFKELAIVFDPFSSITSLKPTFQRIEITGADLVIERDINGQMSAGGAGRARQKIESGSKTENPNPQKKDDKNSETGSIGDWLLSQSNLVIKQSQLLWIDRKSDRLIDIPDITVRLHNNGNKHQLISKINLPKRIGEEIEFITTFNGDPFAGKKWGGELYIRSNALNLDSFKPAHINGNLNLFGGVVDLNLWGRIAQGKVNRLEGRVAIDQFTIANQKQRVDLPAASASIFWQRGEVISELQIRDLKYSSDQHQGFPGAIGAVFNEEHGEVVIDTIALNSVKPFLALYPEIESMVSNGSVDGELRNINVAWNQSKGTKFFCEMNQVQLDLNKEWPMIKGLSGTVHWEDNQLGVNVDSSGVEFGYDVISEHDYQFDKVKGTLFAQTSDDGWQIWSDGLEISNKNISVKLGSNIQLHRDTSPLISLYGDLGFSNLAQIRHYLPEKILPDETRKWLAMAFNGGDVQSGSILFQGLSSEFPFEQNQGIFKIALATTNVDLKFQSEWPKLSKVDASVVFEGNAMTILATKAQMFNSRLKGIDVRINDFSHPYLKIEGGGYLAASDIIKVFNNSPLGDLIGGATQSMSASGDSQLTLKLGIPLSSAVDQDLMVKGKVKINDANFHVANGVDLGHTSGTINFDQQGVEAEIVKTDIYGKPATFSVYRVSQSPEDKRTVIAARGSAFADELAKAFPHPLLKAMEGESDWQAQVEFKEDGSGDVSLKVATDTQGIAFNLPAPMQKAAHEVRPFTLEYKIAGKEKGALSIELENYLKLITSLEDIPGEVSGLHLHLGRGGQLSLPYPSKYRISGSADEVDLEGWMDLLNTDSKNDKRLSKIEIEMERLRLLSNPKSDEHDPQEQRADPVLEDFPEIDAQIERFAYNNLELGQLIINSNKSDQHLKIPMIRLIHPQLRVEGSGTWDGQQGTALNIMLSTTNLGDVFTVLNQDKLVSEGKGSLKGDLTWEGSPFNFDLAKLNGNLRLNLKDGVIEEVEVGGAGNLIGLFSIKSIFKRMALDFSDVREKGVEYDLINGDFRIENGQGYTENLKMDSTPAKVLITGRIGLATEDIDQTVTVVPNVSDTLSVAGALAWGPQTAAVLLLLNKVFEKNIDANAIIQYKVEGSWSEPTVTKIENKKSPPVTDGQEIKGVINE